MKPGNKVTIHKPVRKHSPFIDAAGMVLSVGFTVLGGIGKAIKATTRLLHNREIGSPTGTARITNATNNDLLSQKRAAGEVLHGGNSEAGATSTGNKPQSI
jgi:hypothetical protein